MPKHVVSTTLRDPEWNNSNVIKGDVAGEVTRLKQQGGGPILVVGSRTLVHALMAHNLVDEYRIMIFPVVLGSGGRLFPETQHKTVLRLADSRTFGSGVVVHTYCPEGICDGGRWERRAGSRLTVGAGGPSCWNPLPPHPRGPAVSPSGCDARPPRTPLK